LLFVLWVGLIRVQCLSCMSCLLLLDRLMLLPPGLVCYTGVLLARH
jgi:hypothetical protein